MTAAVLLPFCTLLIPLFQVNRYYYNKTVLYVRRPRSGRVLKKQRTFRRFVSGVASMPVFAYLEGMEVHFTPEQETQLSQIATHAGTDAERLVKDAALRLLQEEARSRAAVREGIAQADRGEFIEEEEMDTRLEQMLRS